MLSATSQSRSQSQHESATRRKRSTTLQSMLRSPISIVPLEVGNSKDLTLWVHEVTPLNPAEVIFNADSWPGVQEGDLIRVNEASGEASDDVRFERDGFLFLVKKPSDEAGRPSNALQISVSKALADSFGLRNHSTVRLTKVDSSTMRSEYIEITFQDQYLGRSDMWRLGKQLQGQCVHIGQDINFIGTSTGKIQNIYIDGRNSSAGLVASSTKVIYRSLSAKVTIFIQVCREIWEFAGDGERYTEKIVHSLLPALFRRWREADTNHTVTIVLISRVYYLEDEIGYAAGPLRQDDEGRWYKDFYKVITDLEVLEDWKPTLVSLKESFVAFQRDILLTHHYHRASIYGSGTLKPAEIKLVGRISFAHEGPILEALNLVLNPMETHYVDRSLSLTGVALILITPGTGHYKVNKRLLRMTTRRLLDQGVGMDLVSLTKRPLHRVPIFSFQGFEPEVRADMPRTSWQSGDPLWGGDMETADNLSKGKSTFWWEPFWIAMSFWDQQMDQPFRQDRFNARARMHQIEMLGLLEHDVLASINVPYLTEVLKTEDSTGESRLSEAENFDLRRFSMKKAGYVHLPRDSAPSSGTTIMLDSPTNQTPTTKRPPYILHRIPNLTSRITPIEESPRRIYLDLPPEGDDRDPMTQPTLSSSPSSSIRSSASNISRRIDIENQSSEKSEIIDEKPSLTTKLTTSWIFSPFWATGKQPPAVAVPSAEVTQTTAVASTSRTPTSMSRAHSTAIPTTQARLGREPMAIRSPQNRRSLLSHHSEDEISGSARSSFYNRHSPLGGTPRSREETTILHRRSTITSLGTSLASSSPEVRTNPLRSNMSIPRTQTALASRWQHMFPQPLYNFQMKWKSMVTPGCLPLTTEYMPTKFELDASYDVHTYEFIVDPSEMKSFLVKDPTTGKESREEARRLWALAIMRGMASLRLVQGFQFIVRARPTDKHEYRKDNYFTLDDEHTLKPMGASEILSKTTEPVVLSVSNEIHKISYTGDAIQVKRYVKRMPASSPFGYKCLVWPKLGIGYTELSTSFGENGLESYGWNRLDMLLAGFEHWQFSESQRYWRTRFIVIPTLGAPPLAGNSDEKLNDEEIRLLGSDKLAELWSKLRVLPPFEKDKGVVHPPLRFLPTYLNPTASVVDEHIVSQLEEILASGPLGKKLKSEREIADTSLSSLAKLMKEDRGPLIRDHRWHSRVYEDSFTGSDFAMWLCREFRDVSTREQAQEWGAKLLEKGLFEHCRGMHGFMDGHYFYRLTNDYTVPRTPKSGRGWAPFRSVTRHVSMDEKEGRPFGYYPGSGSKPSNLSKKLRKRLVLSQTMVIDVDPNKKSNQAETAILHYDLIHNPANVFHFELHWLGTTPRCIEEQLRSWSSRIDRYGLKLVEAYVTQISDIRERNPFQSCYPVRLSLPPPIVPDLDKRLTLAGFEVDATSQYYFEYELLKQFNFILDIEAKDLYPKSVDVFYSYRRNAFTHSQFVHRTGAAFVQVVGGSEGFLFLTNRLMGPGRMGTSSKNRGNRPAAAAEKIRLQMTDFCQDQTKLTEFYDSVLSQLPLAPEEPPALTI